MNATADLPSRWTTTTATDAAQTNNTSTPPVTSSSSNGPHSLLTIDDSSSNTSNTFYGQQLGISLFDDSLGGSATGQLHQLINFAVSRKEGDSLIHSYTFIRRVLGTETGSTSSWRWNKSFAHKQTHTHHTFNYPLGGWGSK